MFECSTVSVISPTKEVATFHRCIHKVLVMRPVYAKEEEEEEEIMDDAMRKLAESVHETLNAIEGVNNVPVSDRPVTLDDADLFNVGGNWLANDEIAEQRRALANAISAEKWVQGAKVAVYLLKLMM